nr:erythrocyte membrane protein 1, PfEMP1, putative [Plasmodium sp. DRC-Itaito]
MNISNSVAKYTNSDPIECQLNLFHKWLDRHRDMCQQWDKNNKDNILDKLKEEWEKDNNKHNGDNIPSDNIPRGNKHSGKLSDIPSSNTTLNTDASIQIDMNTNHVENTNPVDQNPNLVENNNPLDTPTKVQIEMSVKNSEMVKENFPVGDVRYI